MLSAIVEIVSAARRERNADAWKDPDIARRSVALARALYASRRISRQEYILFASAPVEGVHEARWMNRLSDDDLLKIQKKMDVLKKKYRLKPDEYWPVGQAPKDYQREMFRLSRISPSSPISKRRTPALLRLQCQLNNLFATQKIYGLHRE
jgi:hypothetical protein